MSDGIYCALSGALAQQMALDATSTNLANASITGFHTQTPVFREVLAQQGPMGQLRFAEVKSTAMTTTPGAFHTTGRDLDVALPPKVFLAVKTDAGERYTRAGSLQVRADGSLTTVGGAPIVGEGDVPLKVAPGSSPSISTSAEIKVNGESAGRLKLVSFAEPAWLVNEGATLLAPTTDSGQATAAAAEITVGALEDSNASPITAMTELLTASRMFEAFQRAIETFHESDRRVATTTPGS